MMVQALYIQDSTLPPGLTMQNTYTELRKGSKKAVVVVWNHTAYPHTLQKKTPVVRVIPVQLLPETPKPGESTDSRRCVSRPSNSKVND